MSHALAPATPVPTLHEPTLNELHSHEDAAPVTLGYTLDQMPVVVWPRGDDPVLEVGCVQIDSGGIPVAAVNGVADTAIAAAWSAPGVRTSTTKSSSSLEGRRP